MLHRILYNEGAQTIAHVPPVRAATATYSIEDLTVDNEGSGRVLASGSAAVDSLSLSVTAASGPGEADPRRINLTTTTGATVGTQYWLSEDGQGELVTLRSVLASTYAEAEHNLLNTYTTAATLEGVEMSASFPGAQANDEDNVIDERLFRVVWEYTVFSQSRKVQEQIRVVRNTHSDVDIAEGLNIVRTIYPDMDDHQADGTRTLEKWAAVAARLLRGDLLAKDQNPELFLTGDRGAEALAYKIAEIAGENGYAPANRAPEEFVEDARSHLSKIWQSLTRGEAGKETADITVGGDQATDSQSRVYRSLRIGL